MLRLVLRMFAVILPAVIALVASTVVASFLCAHWWGGRAVDWAQPLSWIVGFPIGLLVAAYVEDKVHLT